jgi:hypothetical protein
MVREGEGDEEGIVEQQRPSFVQDFKEAGLVNACEKQWHRTITHMNAYPYVWASYFVVYGTCEILSLTSSLSSIFWDLFFFLDAAIFYCLPIYASPLNTRFVSPHGD